MSLKTFLNSRVKKLDSLDVGLIKWASIAFGIILVMLIPKLATINIWYFVAIGLILSIRPFYRVYLK